jgi:ABC-type amino acid transport substrate-binding protein
MVQANSDIEGFLDLRGGKWIAIANNEPGVRDRVIALAESVNVRVNIYETREQDIAFSILSEDNAEVAFADSLKLIPHVQANPNDLTLTKRQPDIWYSRSYVTFAVPRNDIDFRLLVEYTLQELIRDGTLAALLQPVMMPDEIPNFEIWPGASDYLGISLGS